MATMMLTGLGNQESRIDQVESHLDLMEESVPFPDICSSALDSMSAQNFELSLLGEVSEFYMSEKD